MYISRRAQVFFKLLAGLRCRKNTAGIFSHVFVLKFLNKLLYVRRAPRTEGGALFSTAFEYIFISFG